jgi:hypothetical protein
MRLAPFRPFSFASRAFTRFAFFGNWLPCGFCRLGPIALRHGLSPVLPLVRQLAVMRLAPFRPFSFASRAFTRFALCGNWLPCGLHRLGPIALRHGLSPVLPLGGMKFPKIDRQEKMCAAIQASFGDPPFVLESSRSEWDKFPILFRHFPTTY